MVRGRKRHSEQGGRKPREHLRSVPTYEFRLAVVLYFESHDITSTLARFYPGLGDKQLNTKRKSVYLWRKHKDEITAACASGTSAQMRRLRQLGTATTLPIEAEKHVVQWINAYRDEGLPVSALMLQRKALGVARDSGVDPAVFLATRGWSQGFLKRHQLSLRARTRQGQISPEDAGSVLAAFNVRVKQRMAELNVDVVHNADQTPIFFEYLPKNTINAKGAHTVWVRSGGRDKERLTCMLLGDSTGRKYPPYLVLKTAPSTVPAIRAENAQKRHGFGKRLWAELETMQAAHNLRIYGNKTGWWNEGLTVDFLRHFFSERDDMTVPILLLLDEFSAHWTADVTACAQELNGELMVVPAGCTSVCQPADVAWNRPLKQRLRQLWIEYLETQMKEHDAAMVVGKSFRMLAPDRTRVIKWIASAWDELSADTIANGFSGVLRERELDEEEQAEMERVVGRLEQCSMLDESVGEVTGEQDVVDAALMDERGGVLV